MSGFYGTDYDDEGNVIPRAEDLDGAALLGEVHGAYTRYVIFPSPEAADAMTLYTAATHAQTAWEHASRLVLKSPIRRCGKTRAQEAARELVHNPLPTANISPAALVRSITADDPPTLILDEADTVWGKKEQRTEGAEDLRGILNAGHSRGWPYLRWDAVGRKLDRCPTFAMAIIGGIGDLPDTIEDRAVVISMRRRAPGETVARWRTKRAVPKLRELRDRLHEWVDAQRDGLADADPELPAEDRAADVWEPLVAIADAAGGDWPERARKACRVLAADGDDMSDGSAGERLLNDLYDVWGDAEEELFTQMILERLCAIEEAPWATWHKSGEKLNPRGLAQLLKPWRVKSKNVRLGELQAKGYARADLADAWDRYVLPTRAQPSQPSQRPGDAKPADEGWDGNGTDTRPAMRPSGDQQSWDVRDGGTDGTAGRLNGATCTECGDPLDPALIAEGFTDHGEVKA